MSIISSIDSQALALTQKLLPQQALSIKNISHSETLANPKADTMWIDIDIEGVQHVIGSLIELEEKWQQEETHEYAEERKKILAYLLKQWITIGEETRRSADISRSWPLQ